MYTPFDFNEAVSHRKEYIDERLREGSPVVGLSYRDGLMLVTVRRTQRKVYEIYDRQMFSGIGNQSDIENIRLSAIQIAHQEGFERSPDDVSVQRMVGFALSPALKKAFGDGLVVPFVIRAVFAELGRTPANDVFFTLNYDGEYRQASGQAVVAGTQQAEDAMLERLGEPNPDYSREEAITRAVSAWSVGAREAMRRNIGGINNEEDLPNPLRDLDEAEADRVFLRDELKSAQVEVGVLERRANREGRFRLLPAADVDAVLRDLRG